MVIVNAWRFRYIKKKRRRLTRPKNKRRQWNTEENISSFYNARNEVLRKMGYASYDDYLKSRTWRKIRKKVLKMHVKCILCRHPSTEIHHMDYSEKTLMGFCLLMLVGLCSKCHYYIEYDGHEKNTLRNANYKLKKKASETTRGLRWLAKLKKKRDDERRELRLYRRAKKLARRKKLKSPSLPVKNYKTFLPPEGSLRFVINRFVKNHKEVDDIWWNGSLTIYLKNCTDPFCIENFPEGSNIYNELIALREELITFDARKKEEKSLSDYTAPIENPDDLL